MKTYFLTSIILLFCTFFTSAFGQCSPMAISTFKVDQKSTLVLLDNGSLWKYKDTDLFEGPNSWQIGDRVEIMYIHFKGYFLLNKSFHGSAPIQLQRTTESHLNLPRIQSIDKKYINTDPEKPMAGNGSVFIFAIGPINLQSNSGLVRSAIVSKRFIFLIHPLKLKDHRQWMNNI